MDAPRPTSDDCSCGKPFGKHEERCVSLKPTTSELAADVQNPLDVYDRILIALSWVPEDRRADPKASLDALVARVTDLEAALHRADAECGKQHARAVEAEAQVAPLTARIQELA